MEGTVIEFCDALPEDSAVLQFRRREDLLLQFPKPTEMKLWRENDLLSAVNLPQNFIPAKFAPPRDIFGGNSLRLEWQQMANNRQPFYHRNADVDEISYQVSGNRTLMTELGSVDLKPGDFSRIPVGIAHDNYGREEVHLLFYVPAPVKETGWIQCEAEIKKIQFEGWTPGTAIEMVTECLGARGCDIAVSLADEALLLDGHVKQLAGLDKGLMTQKHSGPLNSTEWLYKSNDVWIGGCRLQKSIIGDTRYHRHRRADVIQCQISGHRTLITQKGMIELEPGDFISIPKGCAYTSIVSEESFHIQILTSREAPLKMEPSKHAVTVSMESVRKLRNQIRGNSS